MTATAPEPNAVNAVFYALSTLAQTCAALAALVGALALYKLQAMREGRAANERRLRELMLAVIGSRPATLEEVLSVSRGTISAGQNPALDRITAAIAEWDSFDGRYATMVRSLLAFEAWNLLAILAALLGFACVSWLASRWCVFVWLLAIFSGVTVAVTGGALFAMARRETT